jgi:glycine hydroxymethyltransferase
MDLGFKIVSNGTDNHLMMVDLTNKQVTGKQAELVLDQAHITTNKNVIPNDPRSPLVTSGVRLGTAAMTTRGMREQHMPVVAELIARVINHIDDETVVAQVRNEVIELCTHFPVPAVGDFTDIEV